MSLQIETEMEKDMFVVGITGGIGSGKTTVADFFRKLDILVLDADEISREITEPDGKALPLARELLGDAYFNTSGALNRKKVASAVFADRGLLDEYSRLIHKIVFEEVAMRLEKERKQGTKVVVIDVPIPVKKGFLDVCDQVIAVSSDDHLRLDRLVARGMDPVDASRRMAMQLSVEEYENLATNVIENKGDLETLEKEVHKYIQAEFGKRGIRV